MRLAYFMAYLSGSFSASALALMRIALRQGIELHLQVALLLRPISTLSDRVDWEMKF